MADGRYALWVEILTRKHATWYQYKIVEPGKLSDKSYFHEVLIL